MPLLSIKRTNKKKVIKENETVMENYFLLSGQTDFLRSKKIIFKHNFSIIMMPITKKKEKLAETIEKQNKIIIKENT